MFSRPLTALLHSQGIFQQATICHMTWKLTCFSAYSQTTRILRVSRPAHRAVILQNLLLGCPFPVLSMPRLSPQHPHPQPPSCTASLAPSVSWAVTCQDWRTTCGLPFFTGPPRLLLSCCCVVTKSCPTLLQPHGPQ